MIITLKNSMYSWSMEPFFQGIYIKDFYSVLQLISLIDCCTETAIPTQTWYAVTWQILKNTHDAHVRHAYWTRFWDDAASL